MKQLLALLLSLASIIGVGKCGGPREEAILDSLDGTTWYLDDYVTPEKYPSVPEKYVGEPTFYYEFGFNTAKRYGFEHHTYYENNKPVNYEYPGYEEESVSYTLDGNKVTVLSKIDGKTTTSTFTIESPTTMTHASGAKYLRKE